MGKKAQAKGSGYSGQDTLIISKRQIMRKSSVTSSILSGMGDALSDSLSVSPAVSDDLEYYHNLVHRAGEDGKYITQHKIAIGGMGAVYHVYDQEFERYSAMKVILPEIKSNKIALQSFMREARITAQLEHPNIIPVHDLGYLDGHGIFFTMKLVSGQPLFDLLREIEIDAGDAQQRYDFHSLLTLFRKVCDAVAFAHSRGIIHRDIKPHNIMVGDYGEVLLMDWGLAKHVADPEPPPIGAPLMNGNHDGQATEAGVVKGSPAYMSPEQAYGKNDELDERSDIFLLGATLYHIFTFFPPYLGDDVHDIVKQAQGCSFTKPNLMETGRLRIPDELCGIIMKCMAASKDDRYQQVDELIADLDDMLHGNMIVEHRIFPPGKCLMREGETGTECYVIETGTVRVQKGARGESIPLGTLTQGDIVGEMALITQEPRSATVTAVTRTEVLVLNQDFFNRNIKQLPPWMSKTIVTLAQRLNEANTIRYDASHK
jgi:serine/threonine protein kinase